MLANKIKVNKAKYPSTSIMHGSIIYKKLIEKMIDTYKDKFIDVA